jgi:hypothetical protein
MDLTCRFYASAFPNGSKQAYHITHTTLLFAEPVPVVHGSELFSSYWYFYVHVLCSSKGYVSSIFSKHNTFFVIIKSLNVTRKI